MNTVFHKYLHDFLIALMGDILIYLIINKFMKNVSVFEVLRKNKLYAMFNKCNFWMKEVLLLDHIISKDDILVDPSIVEAVME